MARGCEVREGGILVDLPVRPSFICIECWHNSQHEGALITRFKNVTTDGAVLELVVWRVPEPVPPTVHSYKYRAVYVVEGKRIVGFDNERGKGDHCHLDDSELPYSFISVEQLIEDFIAAVAARRTI